MCLYLISISSNDDDQFIYISYLCQAMILINVSISHILIKQWWWWSMCLYLISINNLCKINVSVSHIHLQQWWWSMCLYLISISSNDDDRYVYISYPYQAMMMINVSISHIHIKQWWWSMCLHIKQWWWSMCLYLISISCNDDDQCIYF